MSKVMRSVKNVTKGYSSVQVKVREGESQLSRGAVILLESSKSILTLLLATSNDPWGPTGTQMSEIAQLTYNT